MSFLFFLMHIPGLSVHSLFIVISNEYAVFHMKMLYVDLTFGG